MVPVYSCVNLGTRVCKKRGVVHAYCSTSFTQLNRYLSNLLTASKSVANTANKGVKQTGLVHGDFVYKGAADTLVEMTDSHGVTTLNVYFFLLSILDLR